MKTKKLHFDWSKRWIDILCVVLVAAALITEILCIYFYNQTLVNAEVSEEVESLISDIEEEDIAFSDSNAFLTFFFTNECMVAIASDIQIYLNNIMIVLFPLVTSIIAISISVAREEIYGVSLAQFRRLDLKAKYDIKGMIITTIVIVTLCVLFSVLNLPFTLLVLNAFVIVYSILFVCQEVPILVRDNKKIHKIVKYAARYNKADLSRRFKNLDVALWSNDLSTVLGNFVYEEGLDRVDKLINGEFDYRGENLYRLDYLLNSFYGKMKTTNSSDSGAVSQNMEHVLNEIRYFFKRIGEPQYHDLFRFHPSTGISSLLLWTMQESENEDILRKYNNDIQDILRSNVIPSSNINPHVDPYRTYRDDIDYYAYNYYVQSVSTHLVIKSLSKNNNHYLNFVLNYMKRDNSLTSHVLDDDYFVFLSVLLYSQYHNYRIFNEDGKSIWTSFIKTILTYEFNDDKDLSKAFGIYSSLLGSIRQFNEDIDCNRGSYDYCPKFDADDISNWWICSLAANSVTFENNNGLNNEIETSRLSLDEKKELRKVLADSWDSQEHIQEQLDKYSEFFSEFGLEIKLNAQEINSNYYNSSTISEELSKVAREATQEVLTKREIKAKASKFFDDFDNCLKGDAHKALYSPLMSYETKLDISTFSQTITTDNLNDIPADYIDSLLRNFYFRTISGEVMQHYDWTIQSENKEARHISNQIVRAIFSGSYESQHYFGLKINNEIYYVTEWKFDAQVNRENSVLRVLNEAERSAYIDSMFYHRAEQIYRDEESGTESNSKEEFIQKMEISKTIYRINIYIDYVVDFKMTSKLPDIDESKTE